LSSIKNCNGFGATWGVTFHTDAS